MNISVSNFSFIGGNFPKMKDLPRDYGIEVFIEYGTDYYWNSTMKRVMEERTGTLSVHGPFINIDLESPLLDEKRAFESIKWAFDCYLRFGAEFFVQHPNGPIMDATADKVQARDRAMHRIAKLAEIAQSQGIHMLIENMGYDKKDKLLFDYEEFVDIFRQIENVDCLIDVGHGFLAHWDFPLLLKELGPRIKAYHIHDNRGITDNHLPVGQGFFDWSMFFDGYRKYTPDAVLVLEYEHGTINDIIASVNTIKALSR